MTALETPVAASPAPVPSGRGRWRLQLYHRQFADSVFYNTLAVADLATARSRRLEQTLNGAATLTFTLDGRDPAAALAVELATDVIAWRWDDASGADIPVFRGPITMSEDEITEQSHVVNFTCWDYFKMLERRFNTTTLTYAQTDQDGIVADFVYRVSVRFSPGSYLPLKVVPVTPTGDTRYISGQLRDRTYPAQTVAASAIDDLAHVISGFDYDVQPWGWLSTPGIVDYNDWLRIWYPVRGVTRTTPELVYGASVSTVTRSVNSGDYANYWRVVGNNGDSDPATPQLFSEAWNTDASPGTTGSVGLWMTGDNAADVSIQSTLDQQAQGAVLAAPGSSPGPPGGLHGLLMPTYTLGLRPGFYTWGNPNMGDVVPLYVRSGRLNVATGVRVVGIAYEIGDDGQEDVTLTVGRPPQSFAQLLAGPRGDINALVRR